LPSEILEDICRARNLSFEPPEVDQTTLKIGDQIFELEKYGNGYLYFFGK